MADTAVAITAGSGTNIDTRTEATNGDHRQVIVIGDPSTNAAVAPVSATNGLSVTLTTAIPAGSASIGILGANSGVDIGDVTINNASGGSAVNIQDGGNTITVDGTVNATASGDIAHDSADSGNPVKVGGKALDVGATPTAVTANDRVNAAFLRDGVQLVLGGSFNVISKNLNVTDADGAQTDAALVTVAAGTAIIVTQIQVMVDAATTATGGVAVRIGFGTASVPAADSNGILLAHPGIAAGSGVVAGSGSGIIGMGASNEDLRVTCEDPAGGNIDIIITYFTILIG